MKSWLYCVVLKELKEKKNEKIKNDLFLQSGFLLAIGHFYVRLTLSLNTGGSAESLV